MSNFDFLKNTDIYDTFTIACIEAEKTSVISYSHMAISTRRALELAVKWLYTSEQALTVPYQQNLSSLIHDDTFKNLIDHNLPPKLQFIQKLGNSAVHNATPIKKDMAIQALHNLFDFTKWIYFTYSGKLHKQSFSDRNLHAKNQRIVTSEELKRIVEKFQSKDQKLDDAIKENEQLRKQLTAQRQGLARTNTEQLIIKDDLSEEKTRQLYIDLEVADAGFQINKNCRTEVKVTGMPNNSNTGYVDYVLYADNGKPLAVIEAKKASVNPNLGKEQAKLYADCLEQQHGVRPIIFYTNGFNYYLWDDVQYPPRQVSGLYAKKDLEKLIFQRTEKIDLKNIAIDDNISNRTYQKEAINAVCEAFQAGRRKTLLVMATGSGKTRTAISLVDVLQKHNWAKNILFLADRRKLIKQAKANFNQLLKNLSQCNLLERKNDEECANRMIFSTYPTMMNAIDDIKAKDGKKLFTRGHFDLIIIDESHRSIYKKFGAIFEYFDAKLVGLTATPKSDLDKNTYEVFELEDNNPTYAYEYDTAVKEGYLVPYQSIEINTQFMTDGIYYDDLTDEEKEQYEDTFDDTNDRLKNEMFKFLFNKNTVNTVLNKLMTDGIKIESNDKLGKTIIFAKNKRHADFIVEQFNKLYPEYNGKFARAIYNDIKYVDKVMDDFEDHKKMPQIAVSVDMLDTGVDIPDVVNLVFFKTIRSKSKFWQMIGRGTRLRTDLFGKGLHKKNFRIFDYCENFEFFRTDKKIVESTIQITLTEALFNVRADIIKELQQADYQEECYQIYRQELIQNLIAEIKGINPERFDAKLKLEFIDKYKNTESFNNLDEADLRELKKHISPIISAIQDDEKAKRFDCLMYNLEFAALKKISFNRQKTIVAGSAKLLSERSNIHQIKEKIAVIEQVQQECFWESSTVFDHEMVREALRDLMKFLVGEKRDIHFTDFNDQILTIETNEHELEGNNLDNYQLRVNAYLLEHKHDFVIQKLRNNNEILEDDIKYLEKILWQELGSKEDYIEEFGDSPLAKMVLKIVGLNIQAANELFSDFLSDESLNSNQISFVKLIVNHLVEHGLIEKKQLAHHPFNKNGDVGKLFNNRIDIVHGITEKIDNLNSMVK